MGLGGSLGQNWGQGGGVWLAPNFCQARARGHRMRSAHTCFSTFCAPQGPFWAQKGAELAKVGPQLLPGLGPEAQAGRQAGLGRVGKKLAPTFANPRPAGASCVPPLRLCQSVVPSRGRIGHIKRRSWPKVGLQLWLGQSWPGTNDGQSTWNRNDRPLCPNVLFRPLSKGPF